MNSFVYCEEAGDLTGIKDGEATKTSDPLAANDKNPQAAANDPDNSSDDLVEIVPVFDHLWADMILAFLKSKDDETTYDRIYSLGREFYRLHNDVINEADQMYDDYRYDHDNYDSLTREQNLRDMKQRLKDINKIANRILKETHEIDVPDLFRTDDSTPFGSYASSGAVT